MNDRQQSLYRYLTIWCDFTPTEARDACLNPSPKFTPNKHETRWRSDSPESIYSPMEQSKNA
jgi:hypothetical protein